MTDLEDLLASADRHYQRGVEIWNSAGIDNPQFIHHAANAATEELRKSVELFDQCLSLFEEPPAALLGLRALTEAEAIRMETHSQESSETESLMQIVKLSDSEIRLREEALHYLRESNHFDADYLLTRQLELLFSRARHSLLAARAAARMSHVEEALVGYRQGRDLYDSIIQRLEERSPELSLIRQRNKERVAARSETRGISGGEDESSSLRWEGIVYRYSDPPTGSPFEGWYRRALANFHGMSAQIADLEIVELLRQPEDYSRVDDRLDEAIQHTYLAMEAWPDNLEYHQDLFSIWRKRGDMFGCPVDEDEHYYYVRCPLAITHLVGAWYLSPTFEYTSLTCTVCGLDAIECPHFPMQEVDGQVVYYERTGLIMPSISIVGVPEDPACRLNTISIRKGKELDLGGRFRCRFCAPDLHVGYAPPFADLLPQSVRGDIERIHQQLLTTQRRHSIMIDVDPNRNSEKKEKGEDP